MKIKILICSLFTFAFGFSQSHKATISTIQKDGFHKITISPEIRSASVDNLGYFRILDKSKKEVPYVLFNNVKWSSFTYNKIDKVKKESILDSITSYIIPIHEHSTKYCSELSLLISNSNIEKSYSISGSNNQKEWFGLVSNQILSDLNNEKGTSVERKIFFPLNNYKFLKIDLNDKKSLPINVLEIGYSVRNFKMTEITNLIDFKYKISEDKKNKKTIITLSSDNYQRIDGISFDVKTKLFSRNASVFVNATRTVKKRTENFKHEFFNFNLASNTSNVFPQNGFYEKELIVEIDNQDNQPLEISKINVFQNTISVIADLKVNEKYEIILDTTLSKPNYDLVNFTKNIPAELPKATISNLKKMDSESKEASEKSFWQKPIFLWSTILLTLLLLAYFVFSMLKDVEKK
ncbi:hypothetical protein G6N05_06885 [Flavobacterium sp. F372]|uniref:DUF3999 family protein n=1 Tax=Flavobacterium bernardetii TaxID=2813823 RepID=A0ABR7J0K8_9FLAO|nr:hypothetical protein [Flavobacterium bernardetii]MBC5835488.1 hypothetical protein [Flavobacterium bernardetii]NHF69831.1 hypothetical protein [Flavobacterium bernardetii]